MRPSRLYLRLLCPRLALLLGLLLLVGLAACGPAPSDHAASPESRASLGGPSESPPVSQSSPSVRNDPVTQAASPAPLAAPVASNYAPALDVKEAPAPLDPLVVALDDADDDVRTKAMALIEQDWAWAQEAKP